MLKNSYISNFKNNILSKAPKAFILLVVFIIVIECCISYLSPHIAGDSTNAAIQLKIRVTQIEELNRDVIIFGDSSAGAAFNRAVLQHETGLTSLKLTTPARTIMAGNYFLLDEYLQSNNAPKFILLMNIYRVWPRSFDVPRVANVLTTNFPSKMVKVLWNVNLMDVNHLFLVQEMANFLLPSQRNKWEIIRMLKEIIKGREESFHKYLEQHRLSRHEREVELLASPSNRGWNRNNTDNKTEELKTKKDIKRYKVIERRLLNELEFVQANEFYVSKLNNYYLDKFIQKATEKGTMIFICFPPVRDELYGNEAGEKYLYSCKAFLENVEQSHENVILLTNDYYVVTADEVINCGNHINMQESIAYTEMITKNILEYMNSDK